MDSNSLLFAARAYTELIVVLFAICIGWRYAQRRKVLTWWTLWIGVILVLALGIEHMPPIPLRGYLVGAAIVLFVVFLPGWLRDGGERDLRPRSLYGETEQFIRSIEKDREPRGCRLSRTVRFEKQGNTSIGYR